jgi:glycosyltransferase involved in cell wall biosynthesis
MKDTAILITTFLRDDALFKCVKSIRKIYPNIAIFVADTGHESQVKDDFCFKHKCELFKVVFDAGVCMVKNEGLEKIPDNYRYVFVCEDDIVFTELTRLEILRDILEKKRQVGIVGAALKKIRGHETKEQDYNATLRIEDDTIYLEKVEKPQWKKFGNAEYFYCDIITNVFLMRRDVWKQIKWDERYKTTPEHTDFFLLLKYNTSWKIAFTGSVQMEHHVQEYKDHEYLTKRTRAGGYKLLAQKWGVKYYWNSWNKQWGIDNPMGLYTYAKTKHPKQVEENKLTIRKRESRVAIGIKTFMREESLFRTIDSIEKYFPFPYKLYIADDSEISDEKEYRYQQLEIQGHMIIRLPFNSGLSHGRNMIIRKVKEDYILMMDDDILLANSESIERMKTILDSKDDIGLCASMIYSENGNPYGGKCYSRGLRLEIDRGVLFRHRSTRKLSKVDGILFNYADQVVNFFLAKTQVFKDICWDERIKIEYEHIDFFLNLKKTKWKATVCLDTKVTHCNNMKVDPVYFRYRRSAPIQYFYGKYGIGNIINKY